MQCLVFSMGCAARWLALAIAGQASGSTVSNRPPQAAAESAFVATFGKGAPEPGVTVPPPLYLMHYTPDAPRNPQFVEGLRQAPPDILHLGHAVPLNSIFGPTADYSGWKPKLVSPEEILSRQAELRQFVRRLHQAGVAKVICYINPSILGGDHETRAGFWAFYDHWRDYAALGVGPKPAAPPEQWMQRERRSFAPWEPEPNYPLWRYQPCANEPAWAQYQQAVVRLIAGCGYDGVFVDDCIMECRSEPCQQRFADFLPRKFDAQTLRTAFGTNLSLGRPGGRGSVASLQNLRNAETCRFWQESVAGLLDQILKAGQELNPEFFAVANWGATARVAGAGARARSGKSHSVWRQSVAWQMFEEDHAAGNIGPSDVISYLLQFNNGLELGIRPAILSYGVTRGQVEVGQAEAAAGGGGAYVEATAAFPEVRRKWRAFYELNQDLFTGLRLVAPVGLVVSFDEPRYGNDDHLRQAYATARALYKLHVPFATVPLENLLRRRLDRHRVLLLPAVRHLSDAQLAALLGFVRQGGRLLTTRDSGDCDLLAQKRARSPWESGSVFPCQGAPPELTNGVGAVFWLSSFTEIVPQREFKIVEALDLREKAFRARVETLGASPPDRESYEPFLRWLTALAGDELQLTDEAPAVHTVAYERWSQTSGLLIVHAIRYAAPTWGGENTAVKSGPLRLTVPLPAGCGLEGAQALRPGERDIMLQPQNSRGKLFCELPPFDTYALLRLKLRGSKR